MFGGTRFIWILLPRKGTDTPMDPEPKDSLPPPRGDGGYTVLYDQACPMCRSAVARLKAWDAGNRLRFLSAADPEVATRFPWLSRSRIETSLHLVGPQGETWEGAGAVEQLARLLPRWRWTSRIFQFPLVRPMARRIYGWVARHRYRLSCGSHCKARGSEK